MKNIYQKILASTTFLMCFGAAASTPVPSSVEGIPLDSCNWATVRMVIDFRELNIQVEMGKHSAPLLEEMKILANKVKDPNRPVGDQLNKADSIEFQKISQQNTSIAFGQMLESDRKRDIEVIDHLVQVADKNYRWGTEVQEDSPEFLYQSIISVFFPAMSDPAKNLAVSVPPTQVCSVQLALYKIESEAAVKLNDLESKFDLNKVNAVLNGMNSRYHTTHIDRSKLSPDDQKTLDDIRSRVVYPVENEQQFINNLERIRLLETASELIYENGKKDLLDSGGDWNNIGSSLKNLIQNNKLDKMTVSAIGLLRIIAEKIPSEQVKQAMERNKMLDKINKNSEQKDN
jgi:hypothetical protein